MSLYVENSNKHGEENYNVGTEIFVNIDNVSVMDATDDNDDQTCDTSNEFSIENSNEIKPADIPKLSSYLKLRML